MAMFRRDALLQLGGYDNQLSQIGWFGWEDYDMRLRFGQKNYRVGFVRTSFVSTVIIKPRCSTRRTCSKLSWFNISLIVLESCSGGTSHVARCSGVQRHEIPAALC
jgi:hypothetical protein